MDWWLWFDCWMNSNNNNNEDRTWFFNQDQSSHPFSLLCVQNSYMTLINDFICSIQRWIVCLQKLTIDDLWVSERTYFVNECDRTNTRTEFIEERWNKRWLNEIWTSINEMRINLILIMNNWFQENVIEPIVGRMRLSWWLESVSFNKTKRSSIQSDWSTEYDYQFSCFEFIILEIQVSLTIDNQDWTEGIDGSFCFSISVLLMTATRHTRQWVSNDHFYQQRINRMISWYNNHFNLIIENDYQREDSWLILVIESDMIWLIRMNRELIRWWIT